MLAAEISAPVASMAASRQPAATSTASAATRPRISVLRMARLKHRFRPPRSGQRWDGSLRSWFELSDFPSRFRSARFHPLREFFSAAIAMPDHVDQPGDAAKDNSDDHNPLLMQQIVQPGPSQPADEGQPRAAQRQSASAFPPRHQARQPPLGLAGRLRTPEWRGERASLVIIHDQCPCTRIQRTLLNRSSTMTSSEALIRYFPLILGQSNQIEAGLNSSEDVQALPDARMPRCTSPESNRPFPPRL